jgi:hypothetical protein
MGKAAEPAHLALLTDFVEEYSGCGKVKRKCVSSGAATYRSNILPSKAM